MENSGDAVNLHFRGEVRINFWCSATLPKEIKKTFGLF